MKRFYRDLNNEMKRIQRICEAYDRANGRAVRPPVDYPVSWAIEAVSVLSALVPRGQLIGVIVTSQAIIPRIPCLGIGLTLDLSLASIVLYDHEHTRKHKIQGDMATRVFPDPAELRKVVEGWITQMPMRMPGRLPI